MKRRFFNSSDETTTQSHNIISTIFSLIFRTCYYLLVALFLFGIGCIIFLAWFLYTKPQEIDTLSLKTMEFISDKTNIPVSEIKKYKEALSVKVQQTLKHNSSNIATPDVTIDSNYDTHPIILSLKKVNQFSSKQLDNAVYIIKSCEKTKLDPKLAVAFALTSSNLKEYAQNTNMIGLFKIKVSKGQALAKHANLPWQDKSQLYDPEYNATLGVSYLTLLSSYLDNNLEAIYISYYLGLKKYKQFLAEKHSLPQEIETKVKEFINNYKKLNIETEEEL